MKRNYQAVLTFIVFSFTTAYAYAYDTTLAWDSNSDVDIVGYNLYVRNDTSGSYNLLDDLALDDIDPNNPQFMVTDMAGDVTYNFAVTAVNAAGLESGFSNQISVLNGQAILPSASSDNSGGGGGCFIVVAGKKRGE